MVSKKVVWGCIISVCVTALVFAATKKIHYIDQNVCTKCGLCIEECPEEAIMVVEKDGEEVHVIDQEKCTQCGICIEGCPEGAILVVDPEKVEGKKKK